MDSKQSVKTTPSEDQLVADALQHHLDLQEYLHDELDREMIAATESAKQQHTPFDCIHDPTLKFSDLIPKEHLPGQLAQQTIRSKDPTCTLALHIITTYDPDNTTTVKDAIPFLGQPKQP